MLPALLIPLSLIKVPFKRLGIDNMGLMLKSALGHEYNLVILDYAMLYPEAVPFCKATLLNITKELVLPFSRVGIPEGHTHQPGHAIHLAT